MGHVTNRIVWMLVSVHTRAQFFSFGYRNDNRVYLGLLAFREGRKEGRKEGKKEGGVAGCRDGC